MPRMSYAATSLFACLATVALAAPVNARHFHRTVHFHTTHVRSARQAAGGWFQSYDRRSVRHARAARGRRIRVASGSGTVLSGRPSGCPHRYCGCGLSLKVFGHIRPELNLAWNWSKYFRHESGPRVGLVAVRPGHVMQIVGGGPGAWVVFDPNSGGGLTRTHVRDVHGYVFVNPNTTRLAAG